MATVTDFDTQEDLGRQGPNRLRKFAFLALAVAVLALGASYATGPAEAGSCTGYAALEAPILPVVV